MDAIIERYKTECLVEGLSLAEPLDIVSTKTTESMTFSSFSSVYTVESRHVGLSRESGNWSELTNV